jgi:hypothetical protein
MASSRTVRGPDLAELGTRMTRSRLGELALRASGARARSVTPSLDSTIPLSVGEHHPPHAFRRPASRTLRPGCPLGMMQVELRKVPDRVGEAARRFYPGSPHVPGVATESLSVGAVR